ncbi:MAG: hypothetical protein VX936_05010 [Planctomycetota bacterium]|nr:hypothetical protein [Planctomycetota bacterium]MED5576344.1 hypothetical protein [Planctomycetota bacterium]
MNREWAGTRFENMEALNHVLAASAAGGGEWRDGGGDEASGEPHCAAKLSSRLEHDSERGIARGRKDDCGDVPDLMK